MLASIPERQNEYHFEYDFQDSYSIKKDCSIKYSLEYYCTFLL